MEARRLQKRLGPAPIASFEKSFEDTTAASATPATQQQQICVDASGAAAAPSTATTTTTSSSMNHANPVEQADMSQRNGKEEKMEPQESKATAATKTVKTTTNNSKDRPALQQQQQPPQPGISISDASTSAATAGSTKSKQDGNTAAPTTTTITKRPPPLKTATASAVTTLVSSAEAQVVTFKGATTLTTPSTPRIELSRASSSSHHEEDSRDSSPENVFEQVGTGTLQETIGLGFREEGTLELRSSTEELYFMDPEHKKEEQEKIQQQTQVKCSSPHTFKFDEHQSYLQQHQRKDSASSEVAALLATSGRTSRISSVGSHGSAFSRLSAVSGVSRSPSPHRMLLETSFCGPKPLENLADARDLATDETAQPTAAELLEQVLLARKHDPTQAVLAEGIHMQQGSPKRKPNSLANGDTKLTAKIAAQNRPSVGGGATAKTTTRTETLTMGAQRRSTKSPGQMVIGKTPGGTEYIRINLKPDHMYEDKGIAPNERVVEAPNSLAPVYAVKSQKKPVSLSLGRQAMDETRLTPTASPKPSRHSTLSKDGGIATGSRSPSPATISVSRKSSFSSLFRMGGKDSPDSPRERSRSRSKSKERQTPQSQNVTPSKQKSVLAIFKPGKRGSSASGTDAKSSSKSASPIDGHDQHHRSKASTPLITATGSRPNSRLRYYDEPIEGVIHIPLHTPPEEKETRKLLQGIQQLNAEPKPIAAAPITASQLAAAAAALKPVGTRKDSAGSAGVAGIPAAPAFIPPPAPPRPQQIEKLQRIENLDAIHTLSSQDDEEQKARTWSLEVNRHSSQDSQETLVGSEGSYASAIMLSDIRAARSNLTHVKEIHRNGMPAASSSSSAAAAPASSAAAEIHRLPSVESTMSVCDTPRIVETVATVNAHDEDAVAKERRRLLFATRLGSGSQEQIFSTQFSISKTESLSSQLSEQMPETIMESSPTQEHLQRQITVIRRDEADEQVTEKLARKVPLRRHGSVEASATRPTSKSTSEDEKSTSTGAVVAVKMRRSKDSHEELSRQSRATSEEDATDGATTGGGGGGGSNNSIRHSRYLENFDVRKKFHENVPRKPKRQSISEASSTTKLEDQVATTAGNGTRETVTTTARHEQQQQRKPTLPQPPPPSTAPSPSPPPLSSSARASRTPTPPINQKSPPPAAAAAPAPRSQSQSPVDRSGSSSRQTPTKPPRTSTPTRRRGSSCSAHDTAVTPPLYTRPAPPLPQTPSSPASGDISTPPSKHTARKQQHHQQEPHTQTDRQSVHSTDEPLESSDSDPTTAGGGGDSSAATTIDPKRRRHLPHHVGVIDDTESTGLVSQESFDDELPYIPTTLPEERAQGVALIPMKERANMELKTCPVDRPRSTTPLNPSHLEEFGVPAVAAMTQDSAVAAPANTTTAANEFSGSAALVRGEKLRISLPRKDSTKDAKAQSSKSPRRISNTSGKSWFEFAEEGLRANLERKDSNKQILPPPAPPPPPPPIAAQTKATTLSTSSPSSSSSRSKTKTTTVSTATTSSSKAITASVQATHVTQASGAATSHHTSTQRKLSGHWIDFENIPEKRKQPKRITTLPREGASSRQQPMTAASNAAAHHQQHHQHGQQQQQQSLPTQKQQPPDVTTSSHLPASAATGKNNNSEATSDGKLHYNYVKPEDCQCECHEVERAGEEGSSGVVHAGVGGCTGAATLANANNKSITSVDLLQQGEDMLPLLDPDTQDGIEPSDSSREYSCYTDDEMDVPMRHSSSSRSKSSSSKLDEFPRRDVAPSPRNKKFPDNRK